MYNSKQNLINLNLNGLKQMYNSKQNLINLNSLNGLKKEHEPKF